MNRHIIIVIAIFIAGAILFASNRVFNIRELAPTRDLSFPSLSFSLPSLEILPSNDAVVATDAWAIFEHYLEFAKAHNLEGIKSLSYQISAACQDTLREAECFYLMNSIYSIGSALKESDFKHIYYDNRQIIMYTDGPMVVSLYFTRDETNALKVLGLRFCFEDENTADSCAKNITKNDTDSDGWWDSVESLFY